MRNKCKFKHVNPNIAHPNYSTGQTFKPDNTRNGRRTVGLDLECLAGLDLLSLKTTCLNRFVLVIIGMVFVNLNRAIDLNM